LAFTDRHLRHVLSIYITAVRSQEGPEVALVEGLQDHTAEFPSDYDPYTKRRMIARCADLFTTGAGPFTTLASLSIVPMLREPCITTSELRR